ncbi:MAG: hypothetical protein ISS95_00415 [Candidatus Aenigmarchaeota archaeon]|nr:hypothetical protein [Candidatus Aenigmarchaeota archaeon]
MEDKGRYNKNYLDREIKLIVPKYRFEDVEEEIKKIPGVKGFEVVELEELGKIKSGEDGVFRIGDYIDEAPADETVYKPKTEGEIQEYRDMMAFYAKILSRLGETVSEEAAVDSEVYEMIKDIDDIKKLQEIKKDVVCIRAPASTILAIYMVSRMYNTLAYEKKKQKDL